jgi:[acyl-carrier-protein] S-malonyltransferase
MTALLCPGQGAQTPGMGRELADRFPEARALFVRADEALGFELSKVLFAGAPGEVDRTDVCQPGILVVTCAICAVLTSRGTLDPARLSHVAGLSLGEYSAHVIAGSLAFEDAVRLVRRRGRYMQEASEATPSGMAAVMGLEPPAVEACCAGVRAEGGVVVVANLNAPGQVVVSGERSALERCTEALTKAGARRVVALKVAGAFHSPVMQPAADRLAADLAATPFADPRVPVVSNVTAAPVRSAAEARSTLSRQVVEPVLFEKSLRAILATGERSFLEPGPGKTLTAFVRKVERDAAVANYDTVAEIEGGEAAR